MRGRIIYMTDKSKKIHKGIRRGAALPADKVAPKKRGKAGTYTVEASIVMGMTFLIIYSVIILAMLYTGDIRSAVTLRSKALEQKTEMLLNSQTLSEISLTDSGEAVKIWPLSYLGFEESLESIFYNVPKLKRLGKIISK